MMSSDRRPREAYQTQEGSEPRTQSSVVQILTPIPGASISQACSENGGVLVFNL